MNIYLKHLFCLILIFDLLLLSGCAILQSEQKIDSKLVQGKTESKIIKFKVEHDSHDHLALHINYFYEGNIENKVFIGAITKLDGKSTGYWAYRPDPLYKGYNWAKVLISMNNRSPEEYSSDEIEINMYIGGKGTFAKASVPYKKKWEKVIPKNPCHPNWGRGCKADCSKK